MKNYILVLFAVLLFSCQQDKSVNPEVAEEAIKEVVTGETLAYMKKDYEKWSSYWNHSTDVLRLDVTNKGFQQTRGWAKSGGNLETFFNENPEPITSTFENSNYLIFHDANLAWVAFDQTWTTKIGEKSKAKATITLVKDIHSWKIISYTAIQYDSKDGDIDTLGRE